MTFHDFRKRVRSLVKILNYFPLDQSPGWSHPQSAAILARLEALVDVYGDLHDRILAYHKASGAAKKALAKSINDDWDELVKCQKREDTRKTLEDLIRLLP